MSPSQRYLAIALPSGLAVLALLAISPVLGGIALIVDAALVTGLALGATWVRGEKD